MEDLTLNGHHQPYIVWLGSFGRLSKLRSLTLQGSHSVHLAETFTACLHTFPVLELLRFPRHPALFGKCYVSLRHLVLAAGRRVLANGDERIDKLLAMQHLREELEDSECPVLRTLVLRSFDGVEQLAENAGITGWCTSRGITLRQIGGPFHVRAIDEEPHLLTNFGPAMNEGSTASALMHWDASLAWLTRLAGFRDSRIYCGTRCHVDQSTMGSTVVTLLYSILYTMGNAASGPVFRNCYGDMCYVSASVKDTIACPCLHLAPSCPVHPVVD